MMSPEMVTSPWKIQGRTGRQRAAELAMLTAACRACSWIFNFGVAKTVPFSLETLITVGFLVDFYGIMDFYGFTLW